MILRLHVPCGVCGCDGNCKPQKAAPYRAAPVRKASKIEREIAKYPKAIQDQIRKKLT